MDEGFEIPVLYRNQELNLPARLLPMGFIYRIEVEVNETMVQYERDEEGSWRALVSMEELDKNRKLDRGLLEAIAHSIDTILQ